MEYLKVDWRHSFEDEPIALWYELDDLRRTKRVLELFPDGQYGYASETQSARGTMLSGDPLPSNADIDAQLEFTTATITCEEFEQIWVQAVNTVS